MHLESWLIGNTGCFFQIFLCTNISISLGLVPFIFYNILHSGLFLKQNFLQKRQNSTDDYDIIIDKEDNLATKF